MWEKDGSVVGPKDLDILDGGTAYVQQHGEFQIGALTAAALGRWRIGVLRIKSVMGRHQSIFHRDLRFGKHTKNFAKSITIHKHHQSSIIMNHHPLSSMIHP